MYRFLRSTAVGLSLLPLGSSVLGAELTAKPAVPPAVVRPLPPTPAPAPAVAKEGCTSHGTRIDFVDTPSKAARIAKKEHKLVFVLHVSGHFEDPRFT